jgi:hypothetical protein
MGVPQHLTRSAAPGLTRERGCHHVMTLDLKRDFFRLATVLDMPTTSLAGNVQESKAQRQERLKSRFRDRGGCVRLPRLFLDVRPTHAFININQHLRAFRGERAR